MRWWRLRVWLGESGWEHSINLRRIGHESRPQRLKPGWFLAIRGAEAPLFHVTASVPMLPREKQVTFGFAQGRLSTTPSLALRLRSG